MMRYFSWSIVSCLMMIAVWLIWDHIEYVENGDFLTLEARYTPEEIFENQKSFLLGGHGRTLKGITVKYHPYLMMDVKYPSVDKKTREEKILWSLFNGEILLNTDKYEITHGYQDALVNRANRNDYKILYALSKYNGALRIEQLQRELRVEEEAIDNWVASARAKHLITQSGNTVQLHFENPKLVLYPQTLISQAIVTKPYAQAEWLRKKFTKTDIETNAKMAFGSDFTIRASQEIYLPVTCIHVQNASDHSVVTSYWSPLTGHQLSSP